MHLKGNAPQQRQKFEANMQLYLERGIKHLQDKGILK
jgi:hypothetical protein